MTAPAHTDVRIADALADLAAQGGADDIAAYLLAEGHRGTIHDPSACPLCCYLEARDLTGVEIQPDGWRLGRDAYGPLPPAVAEFVLRFDRGHFPDLEVEAPAIRAFFAQPTDPTRETA